MGPGPARDALLCAQIRSVIRIKSFRICRTAGFRPHERPDIEQELMAALIRKFHQYDPARASLYTWASRVLDTEALMLVRNRHRLKRAQGFRTHSLETGSVRVRGRNVPLRELVTDADRRHADGTFRRESAPPAELAAAIGHAVSGLPPKLLKLAKLLMAGTPASAAAALGISRRQLYADMADIRRRFSGAGLDGQS